MYILGLKMNTLFIQFYYFSLYSNIKTLLLCNGFSAAYSTCKALGKVIWMRYDLNNTIEKLLEENVNIDIPEKAEEIYVSAFYNVHVNLCFHWANKYPSIKFIVGGPAVRFGHKLIKELPKNLHLLTDDIRDVLKGEHKWGIDFPTLEDDFTHIFLGYGMNSVCYWNECIFCNLDLEGRKTTLDINFTKAIPTVNKKIFNFLAVPAFTENLLKLLEPLTNNSDDNMIFRLFIRAEKKIANSLKNILPKCKTNKLSFFPGLEFPSNRMLKFINKGITLDDFLSTTSVIKENNCKVKATLMLGWNNLQESDLEEADVFLSKLRDLNLNLFEFRVLPIMILNNSNLEKMGYFSSCDKRYCVVDPYYVGWKPILDDKQEELNRQLLTLLDNYKIPYNDWYTPDKFWNWHGM